MNEIEFGDPWDFERVYETLFKFARTYPFEADLEDYLIHITTGACFRNRRDKTGMRKPSNRSL